MSEKAKLAIGVTVGVVSTAYAVIMAVSGAKQLIDDIKLYKMIRKVPTKKKRGKHVIVTFL